MTIAVDRQRGRKAMIWSVIVLHLWGTALIFAVVVGKDSPIIADMFSAITMGIAANLAVIAGDKGLMEFVKVRNLPRQESITKEPQQDEQPPAA